MIELAFIACMMTTQGEVCENKSLVYTDVSIMQCMIGAQMQLATWVSEHPNWKINSWKCKVINTNEFDA